MYILKFVSDIIILMTLDKLLILKDLFCNKITAVLDTLVIAELIVF